MPYYFWKIFYFIASKKIFVKRNIKMICYDSGIRSFVYFRRTMRRVCDTGPASSR